MKKILNYLIIGLLCICGIFNIFDILPLKNVVKENIWIEDYVQISAHRGGAALNPENSRKAFDYVIRETSYTDIVEIDVRLTKDNVIVINHDSDINRMALEDDSPSVKIKEYDYEYLKKFNLGKNFIDLNGNKPYFDYSIYKAKLEGLTLMSLEDFFTRYNRVRNVKLFLEIKEDGDRGEYVVDKIIDLFNNKYSWWKDRTMFITFSDELVDYIASNYPRAYVGALGDKVAYQIGFQKMNLDIFYNPNYQSVQIPYNDEAKEQLVELATRKLVLSAHNRNQLVVYWGTNSKSDMKRLVDIGVDVITTDRPDLLKELLNRY